MCIRDRYYPWEDADGKIRDKFMVCVPVSGTSFMVAATTYLDEFLLPVREVEKRLIRELGKGERAFVTLFLLSIIGAVIAVGEKG